MDPRSTFREKTVLVTGGAGYIGAHAVHRLLDAGHRPVVLDDLSVGCPANLPDGVSLIQGDVGDEGLLADVFGRYRIEAVMHFAGSIVVSESFSDPGRYYANNTVNTLTLVRQMTAFGIPHLVFSSTAAVYGAPGPDDRPLRENGRLHPVSPYGASKLMSERIIRDLGRAHGITAAILRYFNVAGADPDGRAGQSTPNATHLIKVAAEWAAGKRDCIPIYGTDYPTRDGTCIRDYIHVDDLITAHLLALENLFGGADTEVFNCGYGRGYSVLEVLDTVERLAGRELRRVPSSRRAGDPPVLIADTHKIRKRLGWTPSHNQLDEMVCSAVAWERSLP